MRIAGAVTAGTSAIGFIASLALLPYGLYTPIASGTTLWDVTTRWPAILTGLACLALILACAGLLTGQALPAIVTACIGFYIFGQVFYINLSDYSALSSGYWVSAGCALLIGIGGLAACTEHTTASGFARPSQAAPSPGWYPDPAGQASLRYWTGQQWTADVRS